MARIVRIVAWVLTGLTFAYNLYLWGGVATTPWVGPHIASQARVRSPLTATYMFGGRQVLAVLWLEGPARDHAQVALGARYNDSARDKHGGVEYLLGGMTLGQRLAFYGAPLLLLLDFALIWLKKRQQHRLRPL